MTTFFLFFDDDDDTDKTAVPFLLHVSTCTTFPTRVICFSLIIECPRPEFGNTFQERLLASRKSKTKCHNFNSTYLVHFNVLFLSLSRSPTPDYSKRSHDDSGTYVHTNWMDAIEIIATFFFFFAENICRCRGSTVVNWDSGLLFFLGNLSSFFFFVKEKVG